MKLSAVISNLIRISEIKPKDLSERIGYDVSYISKWSTGKLLPSVKTSENLFQLMADAFTEKIWYNRKELELRDLLERRLPLETEENVHFTIFRLLRDSFNSEKAVFEERYPENTYIFVKDNSTAITLSIISKLLPQKRGNITIYCSVNFAVMMREFLLDVNKTYASKDIIYNIKVLIPKDRHGILNSEEKFHMFSLLGKMTVYNIDFYQTQNKERCDYIYVEVEGGSDGVILLNKTVENATFLLSYSTDSRVTSEYRWRNDALFQEEEKIVASVNDKYFEYSSLVSCLYPNSKVEIFTSFFESMFMSKYLLGKLLKRRNIPKQEGIELQKIRNLYNKIVENSDAHILIPKSSLIRKVQQREVVLGKYTFKLDDEEWKIYKTDIYNACTINDGIQFGLLQEKMLPISVRQMSVFMIITNRRAWLKKEPKYLDPFTKPYLDIIDQRIVNNLRYTLKDFTNSSFIEDVDLRQFMQYISNIESIT